MSSRKAPALSAWEEDIAGQETPWAVKQWEIVHLIHLAMEGLDNFFPLFFPENWNQKTIGLPEVFCDLQVF